jgi:CRISPR-associated protein Cas2
VSPKSGDAVWSMVMFDLPVKTKTERSQATRFRELLLDLGYQRAQFSVYVRFSPSVNSIIPTIGKIKKGVPNGGEVRILTITDRQWATALRFSNARTVRSEDTPLQLAIF